MLVYKCKKDCGNTRSRCYPPLFVDGAGSTVAKVGRRWDAQSHFFALTSGIIASKPTLQAQHSRSNAASRLFCLIFLFSSLQVDFLGCAEPIYRKKSTFWP
jgi:hypothetical protein